MIPSSTAIIFVAARVFPTCMTYPQSFSRAHYLELIAFGANDVAQVSPVNHMSFLGVCANGSDATVDTDTMVGVDTLPHFI